MTNAAEIIARRVSGINYSDLPPPAIDSVKRALVDTIGVAIAGSREPCARILMLELACDCGNSGVTVIGHNLKASPTHAALINGTSAHALDLDDTGASSQGHPSAVLLPALLALGERNGAPGWKIIEAYVAGVEVLNKLSRLCPNLHAKGLHPTSVLGAVAATAACGRLIDLSPEQLANALGMSTSFSAGEVGNFGTMTKPLHAGNAAMAGVLCASAAKKGFTASKAALAGENGLLARLTQVPSSGIHKGLEAIGETLAVLDPGLHVKLHPSCALSHRILDIVLHLTTVNDLVADQVEYVRCRATRKAEQILVFGKPSNPLEGKFSIPYLVAVALLHRAVPTGAFSEKALNDAKLQELMARVDFRAHEDWDEVGDDWRPDIVEITLGNGQLLRGQAVYPRGHANNPLGVNEIKEKFMSCTGGILPPGQDDRLCSDLFAFDSLADVREISSKLHP